MRLIALAPLALLAACQVSEGNDSVTVSYNEDVAENAVDDLAAGAKEAGNVIAAETKEAGEKIAAGAERVGDKIENTDVDVTVRNEAAN